MFPVRMSPNMQRKNRIILPKSPNRNYSSIVSPKGELTIDDGATKAIKKGYSILPAGILSTEGDYEKGDLIKIVDQSKTFIGTGLTHFNNSEVELIKGSKSENIETILDFSEHHQRLSEH